MKANVMRKSDYVTIYYNENKAKTVAYEIQELNDDHFKYIVIEHAKYDHATIAQFRLYSDAEEFIEYNIGKSDAQN